MMMVPTTAAKRRRPSKRGMQSAAWGLKVARLVVLLFVGIIPIASASGIRRREQPDKLISHEHDNQAISSEVVGADKVAKSQKESLGSATEQQRPTTYVRRLRHRGKRKNARSGSSNSIKSARSGSNSKKKRRIKGLKSETNHRELKRGFAKVIKGASKSGIAPLVIGGIGGAVTGGAAVGGAILGGILLAPAFSMTTAPTIRTTSAPTIMPTESGTEAPTVNPARQVFTRSVSSLAVMRRGNTLPTNEEVEGLFVQLSAFFEAILTEAFPNARRVSGMTVFVAGQPVFEAFDGEITFSSSAIRGNFLVTDVYYTALSTFEDPSCLPEASALDTLLEEADYTLFVENYVPNVTPEGSIFLGTVQVATDSGLAAELVTTAARSSFVLSDTNGEVPGPVEIAGIADQLSKFFTDLLKAAFAGFESLELTVTSDDSQIQGMFTVTDLIYSITSTFTVGFAASEEEINAVIENADYDNFISDYVPDATPEDTLFQNTLAIMTEAGVTAAPITTIAPTSPGETSQPTSTPSKAPTFFPTSAPSPPVLLIQTEDTLRFFMTNLFFRFPTQAEIDGVVEQIGYFYADVLRVEFPNFDGFTATEISNSSSPNLQQMTVTTIIEYQGTSTFTLSAAGPTQAAVEQAIFAADLFVFLNDYIPLAEPLFTTIFLNTASVTSLSTPTPTQTPTLMDIVETSATLLYLIEDTTAVPSQIEIDGAMQQVNSFYTDVLAAVFSDFQSFTAVELSTVSEPRPFVRITQTWMAYAAQTMFTPGSATPTVEAVEAEIAGADLMVFLNDYLLPNVNSNSLFVQTTFVESSSGTFAPTSMAVVSASNPPSTTSMKVTRTPHPATKVQRSPIVASSSPSSAPTTTKIPSGAPTMSPTSSHAPTVSDVPSDAPTVPPSSSSGPTMSQSAPSDAPTMSATSGAPTISTTDSNTSSVPTLSTTLSDSPTMSSTSFAAAEKTSTSAPTMSMVVIETVATLIFVMDQAFGRIPRQHEISGVMQQVNLFFTNILTARYPAFDGFTAVETGTESEKRGFITVTRVAYTAYTTFTPGPSTPSSDEIANILDSINFRDFISDYIPNATPTGNMFSNSISVTTSMGTAAPTPYTEVGTFSPSISPRTGSGRASRSQGVGMVADVPEDVLLDILDRSKVSGDDYRTMGRSKKALPSPEDATEELQPELDTIGVVSGSPSLSPAPTQRREAASSDPTHLPTSPPTSGASEGLSEDPTSDPSGTPTTTPTDGPTVGPTFGPTDEPTFEPTVGPTWGPIKDEEQEVYDMESQHVLPEGAVKVPGDLRPEELPENVSEGGDGTSQADDMARRIKPIATVHVAAPNNRGQKPYSSSHVMTARVRPNIFRHSHGGNMQNGMGGRIAT